MFLIAGLGNPDKKYEKTRHNIGFDTVDALAEKYNISITEKKHKALCGSGVIEGVKVILAKPQTYMNLSGESIAEIVNFYKLDPESEMLIIFDDISLAPGNIRVKVMEHIRISLITRLVTQDLLSHSQKEQRDSLLSLRKLLRKDMITLQSLLNFTSN